MSVIKDSLKLLGFQYFARAYFVKKNVRLGQVSNLRIGMGLEWFWLCILKEEKELLSFYLVRIKSKLYLISTNYKTINVAYRVHI